MTDPDRPHDLPLAAIEAAAARLQGRVARTPMLASRTAARIIEARTGVRLGAGPADDAIPRLFVKAEHLQVTGSFKPRGAINKLNSYQFGGRALTVNEARPKTEGGGGFGGNRRREPRW